MKKKTIKRPGASAFLAVARQSSNVVVILETEPAIHTNVFVNFLSCYNIWVKSSSPGEKDAVSEVIFQRRELKSIIVWYYPMFFSFAAACQA